MVAEANHKNFVLLGVIPTGGGGGGSEGGGAAASAAPSNEEKLLSKQMSLHAHLK